MRVSGLMQIFVTVLILLVSASAQIFWWPWSSVANNFLDVFLLMCLTLISVAGSVFIEKNTNEKFFSGAIIFILSLCFFSVVLGVIIPFASQFSEKFQKNEERKVLGLAFDFRIVGTAASQMTTEAVMGELNQVPAVDLYKLRSSINMIKMEVIPHIRYISALRGVLSTEGYLDERLDSHAFGRDMPTAKRLSYRNTTVLEEDAASEYEVDQAVEHFRMKRAMSDPELHLDDGLGGTVEQGTSMSPVIQKKRSVDDGSPRSVTSKRPSVGQILAAINSPQMNQERQKKRHSVTRMSKLMSLDDKKDLAMAWAKTERNVDECGKDEVPDDDELPIVKLPLGNIEFDEKGVVKVATDILRDLTTEADSPRMRTLKAFRTEMDRDF
ncbi:unnamed protein product [Vitrella brassicaformis CCMP3155]|uniref:Uncharacterized protein n=1 Tax=Vitrella brassicaformis (strain CCMP3155) TaxID=1169540 RepID=A0A0G4G340_VITBC|nr:unnamed protein product [Vitrella brassicaformis CCMP3155]|eukprot:CEM22515.1 unnamed protein product [Vitrella brassicaformis CCMP3155]